MGGPDFVGDLGHQDAGHVGGRWLRRFVRAILGSCGGIHRSIHSHHVAYEQALNGVLGKRAATSRNAEVYTKFFAALSDSNKTWSTLLELENIAVATHTAIIEKLSSAKIAALIASVVTVEARHAAILATQISSNLSLALDNPEQALVSQ